MKAKIQICQKCGFSKKSRAQKRLRCSNCGHWMIWKSTVGIADGDYNHISESLAINPNQIVEHKAHFPDVDVLPDGRIHLTSVRQHDNYLKATGFHKHPQKIRNVGKKRLKASL